ncbi:MAG: hypothetical protein HUK06_07995 [Bacteroidaceae bacterium]|nr:hypothetical protein [Bacteroidaceae bacterium]
MLDKLGEIKALTTNLVVTCDMGIQFDVMTSKGVCTNIGNVGNWPCYKMPITPELLALKKCAEDGANIPTERVLEVEVCKELLSYTDMFQGKSWVVEDDVLSECVRSLVEELKDINLETEFFYAFADLEEWGEHEIKIFNDYDDLCEYFGKRFGSDDELYAEMDDEELLRTYQVAEEYCWNGVQFKNFCDVEKVEDNH